MSSCPATLARITNELCTVEMTQCRGASYEKVNETQSTLLTFSTSLLFPTLCEVVSLFDTANGVEGIKALCAHLVHITSLKRINLMGNIKGDLAAEVEAEIESAHPRADAIKLVPRLPPANIKPPLL